MNLYFLAMLCLGMAGMIENRCSTPGLRPEYAPADRAFGLLGRFSFSMWVALIIFGFWKLHWLQPVAAIVGSLAANTLLVANGARTWWPAASMGLALLGLGMTSKLFFDAF
jgi:hypothetical protein